MAKRSRRPSGTSRTASGVRDEASTRVSGQRVRRASHGAQRSFFDRFGAILLGVFALAGLAAIVFLVAAPGSSAAYACSSLLTPGPSQSVPPYVPPTPTPSPTPTPGATPSPSPAASASPTASARPSSAATPSASHAATATASASPTATVTATPAPSPSPTPQPTTRLGFVTKDLGRDHVLNASQKITYDFCPPDSGPHYNIPGVGPMARGFYPPSQGDTSPGRWVHNLEHGYVDILYSCGKDGKSCPSATELAAMQTVFNTAPGTPAAAACGYPNKVLVVRFDSMTTRFALVSWDRELLTNTFNINEALVFIQQNEDQTNPEQGAC